MSNRKKKSVKDEMVEEFVNRRMLEGCDERTFNKEEFESINKNSINRRVGNDKIDIDSMNVNEIILTLKNEVEDIRRQPDRAQYIICGL